MKGLTQEALAQARKICTMGGCVDFGAECLRCGFERREAEYRKTLPMILGKDGLRRKYTGKKPKDTPPVGEGQEQPGREAEGERDV